MYIVCQSRAKVIQALYLSFGGGAWEHERMHNRGLRGRCKVNFDTCVCNRITEEELVLENPVAGRDCQQHVGSERELSCVLPQLLLIAIRIHHNMCM